MRIKLITTILSMVLPMTIWATDLQISKSVSPDPVPAGGDVDFILVVDNTSTAGGGPYDSPNTIVTDIFPEGLSVLNVKVNGELLDFSEWDSEWVGNQEKIIVDLGTVEADEIVTVTIRAFNGAGGGETLTNFASVYGQYFDPDTSNNETEVSFQVGTPATDLVVRKTASATPVPAGSQMEFRIEVDNTSNAGGGPYDSPNTLFTDDLPHGVTFVSATASNGAEVTHNAAEETLFSSLGTIPAGEIVIITVVCETALPGEWTNSARALGDAMDINLENNSSDVTFIIGDPVPPSTGSGINDGSPGSQADPVLTATGEFYFMAEADLEVKGPMNLTLERTYNSSFARNGLTSDLGANWRHSFDWRILVISSGVYITNPIGQVLHFEEQVDGWALQTNLHHPFQLLETGEGEELQYHLFDPKSRLRYTFSIPDGDTGLRCVLIADPQGAVLNLDYTDGQLSRVFDGLGRELTFVYNEGGLLVSATDGQRSVSYGYTDSLLTEFTDAGTNVTTYAYTEAGGFEGLLLSETRPEGNQSVSQTWDSEGRVATQTTGTGNVTTFSYGENETTVTDPAGNETVHVHSPEGNLDQFTDAAGRTANLSMDSTGRRTGITRPSGASRMETFDPESGLLASETHAEGGTISNTFVTISLSPGFEYREIGETSFPDGTSRVLQYDENGNLVSLTTRSEATTLYEYDSIGRMTKLTNPLGGITMISYDASGNLETITDASGNTTTYGYDALSRMVSVDFPGPGIRTYTYDYANRLTGISDESGLLVSYAYDMNGNMVEKTGMEGITEYLFDETDRLMAIRPPSGEDVDFVFDELSRPETIQLGTDYDIGFTFDETGEVLSLDAPGSGLLSRSLDSDGKPASLTDAENRSIEYTLDGNGLPTEVTYPGGVSYGYEYDTMGRIISRTYPDGKVDHYAWSGEDLLTSITVQPSGLTTQFTHDAMGNLLEQSLDGVTWSFMYDAASRITSSTDPLGNETLFAYDANNRWSQVTFPDEMGTLDFTYDSYGRTLSRDYSDGTDIQNVYDAAGRKISSNRLELGYDAEDRVTDSNGIEMTWEPYIHQVASVTLAPDKTITYTYDSGGRLVGVQDWIGAAVTCEYDATGRRTALSRGNGRTTVYTYDAMGRISSLDHEIGTITVNRDPVGSILSVDSDLPVPVEPVPEEGIFDYNDLNQITGYSYDALGRRTSDDDRTYSYDLADRLMEVEQGGNTTSFSHDGSGLVVEVEAGAQTTEIVWNYAFEIPVPQIIRVDGEDAWYYITSPGGDLLYRINAQTDAKQYYHFDAVGHTVALTDASGAILATYGYSPFGGVVSSSPELDNPFTYVGKYGVIHQLETDLYIMRHRVYDPFSRQFLTRDPFYLLPYPQSMNQYQYAAGDPINNIDPTGLAPLGSGVASVHSASGGPTEALDTASTASSTASATATASGGLGRLLDAGADLAHVKANQALGASLSIGHEVGRTIEANMGGNAATQKFEKIAEGYGRQAQRLDNLSDGLRTGAKPLNALGKASKVLGPLSLGIEAYRGYNRIARSLSRTDETLRVTLEAFETRQRAIIDIWREKKKSIEWLREQMDKNLAGYLEEAKGINDAGLYDGLINIWVTAGDMIGTLIPGYGIFFGTEDIANFTHQHVWQHVYH